MIMRKFSKLISLRSMADRLLEYTLVELLVIVLCLQCGALEAAGKPGSVSDDSSVDLIVTDDRGSELQLEIRQMPLTQVLDSLARQVHVPIHYSALPTGLVTATCVGTALTEILKCLLSRETGIIARYAHSPANANEIAEVWILGSTLDDRAAGGSECALAAKRAGKAELRKVSNKDLEPDLTDELLKMGASKNPEQRADAIGALLAEGRQDDPAVKAALEAALNDQDANVRAQAISSLAHREGSDASAAIQQALNDDSVDVRMMAVDGTDDIALLQQAMNDSDETVRSLAAIKLEELSH